MIHILFRQQCNGLTGIILVISLLMMATGCSSWRTGLSRSTADWSNRSAQISCYSGGQLIYSGKSKGLQ